MTTETKMPRKDEEPYPLWIWPILGACLGICTLGLMLAIGSIFHLDNALIAIWFIPFYMVVIFVLFGWPKGTEG